MSYTNAVVQKLKKYYQQDDKLLKLSNAEGELSQRRSEEIIQNMQILTGIRTELDHLLSQSGDLSEYIQSIEKGMVQLKVAIEADAAKTVTPGFFQRMFGSADPEKMKEKGDIKGLFNLMTADLGGLSKQAFDTLLKFDNQSAIRFLQIKEGLAWKKKEFTAVMMVLKEIGPSMVDPLVPLLETSGCSQIETATFALGILGDSRAAYPLWEVLQKATYENWFARIIAAHYIGRLSGSTAQKQKALIDVLMEANPIIVNKGRGVFIKALGEIGGHEAVSVLRKMSKDNSSPEMKKNIEAALEKIQKRSRNKQPMNDAEISLDSYAGGFDEPYCSKECLDKGGKYISSVMLKKQTGVCGFCQVNVQASMYGESNCAVVPYEGVNLFICNSCAQQAKDFLRDYNKCCMCQKSM